MISTGNNKLNLGYCCQLSNPGDPYLIDGVFIKDITSCLPEFGYLDSEMLLGLKRKKNNYSQSHIIGEVLSCQKLIKKPSNKIKSPNKFIMLEKESHLVLLNELEQTKKTGN